ncbi:MAG: DUF2798 domain-containing protein [Alphaproteobacteria bacterium]|nr:DUF2798 domain-containing protein [Alphaproteobacteria bacterium]
MRQKLPARYNAIAVPLLLSLMMTCIVSGIATVNSIGLPDGFVGKWMQAWLYSWIVAFPIMLFVLPVVRRIVALFVEPPRF